MSSPVIKKRNMCYSGLFHILYFPLKEILLSSCVDTGNQNAAVMNAKAPIKLLGVANADSQLLPKV